MLNDKVKEMVWSYSRLSMFAQCKYAFYLKYIIADDEQYLAEGNYYAELGSFIHLINEMIFKGQLNKEDAPQYFIDHYDDNVFYKDSESSMDKSFNSCLDYLEGLDLSAMDNFTILGVEKEFSIKIRGYDFKGFIDLLLMNKETGDIIVVDHKSSKYPFSKKTRQVLKSAEKNLESYKHQMYLYSEAVKKLYGVYPSFIAWNHFKEQEVAVIPFDQKEHKKAISWFVKTIHQVERELDYPETVEWFYCSKLCDFRASCEYNKQSKS